MGLCVPPTAYFLFLFPVPFILAIQYQRAAVRSPRQNPAYSTHAPNRPQFYKRRVLWARESHEESESSKKKISGVPELPLNQKFRILSVSWEYQNPPSRTPMPPAAPAQQKANQESPPPPLPACLLLPPCPPPPSPGGGGGVLVN